MSATFQGTDHSIHERGIEYFSDATRMLVKASSILQLSRGAGGLREVMGGPGWVLEGSLGAPAGVLGGPGGVLGGSFRGPLGVRRCFWGVLWIVVRGQHDPDRAFFGGCL